MRFGIEGLTLNHLPHKPMIEAPKAIEDILTLYVTHVMFMLDEEEDLCSLKAACKRATRLLNRNEEEHYDEDDPSSV